MVRRLLRCGWVVVLLAASGCQTIQPLGKRMDQCRFLLVEQAVDMKNVEYLENLLLQESMDKWAEAVLIDTFRDKDDLWVEGYYYGLRQQAALKMACGCFLDFDRILARYYYGDLKTAKGLSDEIQIKRAVQRLVRIGPRNERALEYSDMSPTMEGYDVEVLSVGADESKVKVSISHHGKCEVTLRRRLLERVEIWIPVDSIPTGVY